MHFKWDERPWYFFAAKQKETLYCVILHTVNLSNSQSQMDDIIYNQLPPSHHHHDLEPQRLALPLECIISSVHPCKSQFATSATMCIQRKASSQYDALGATKWWSLVCSFIFCTLVHLGLALILPTMDASLLITQSHLWIASFNNEPQSLLFIFFLHFVLLILKND